jgi:hypothetical protein
LCVGILIINNNLYKGHNNINNNIYNNINNNIYNVNKLSGSKYRNKKIPPPAGGRIRKEKLFGTMLGSQERDLPNAFAA